MTVYRPPRQTTYKYDFWLDGERHMGGTGLTTKSEAKEFEARERAKLRRQNAGLEAADVDDTPRFSDWAEVTIKHQTDKKKLKDPGAAASTMRMILAFWGARPTETPPVEGGEYRDLRLGDPIARPELIEAFEAWMRNRKLSGSRMNQYRSACSMLYKVARLPANRRQTGVRENPFTDLERDRVQRRTAVMTPDQVETWIAAAPPAVAIAVSLGVLSPALRLQNVVDLRRDQLSPDLRFLTVPHKADRLTGLPMTVAISAELRRVLEATFKAWPKDPYVVPLKGERYWQLFKLVKASIEKAGLPYGRKVPGGITFHSLRHAANTWLARWGLSQAERQATSGHTTPAMSAWYTHLSGVHTVKGAELLGRKVRLSAQVLQQLPKPARTRAKKIAKGAARQARRSRRPRV